MKKVCILILCLFSFMGITSAATKHNAKAYVKPTRIVAKKGEKFKVTLYFEAKKFDAYALLCSLDYDKDKLELVDTKGINGYEVTAADKMLADRVEIPKKDDHKVATLTFKVKKEGSTKITLKDINVADMNEQFDVKDITIKVSNSSSNIVIYCAIGVAIVAAGALFIKNKKKK